MKARHEAGVMKSSSILLAFGLLLLAGCASTETAPAAPAPNIVLIFADDLGIGDTSAYGSKTISTPNIDALAAAGVQFSQAYVSHPVCSPSRAGLLTGRYQQRHGWEFNPAGRDVRAGLSLDEQTLADAMRARGYRTGMIGKWHLGHQQAHHPMSRGFDEFFGVLEGGSIFIDSRTPGVEGVGRGARVTERPNKVLRGFAPVAVDRYLTDVFTEEALGFIERNERAPFFLYLSHTTPHTPLQATRQYLDRYRHIEDPAARVYAAMVASLDDSVGAVVTKLEETGQYDNTLIVFLSDNGCAGYIGNACSNGPHAGFKRYHHEGGIRVPMIASWPAVLPAGRSFDDPVISLDLMATFTAAAGDALRTRDSVNLIPFLTGNASGAPHDYLYWRSGPTAAIRDHRWKLIQYARSPLTRADLGADGRLRPPEDGWPMDAAHGKLTLLYDLDADPGETRNLAGARPAVVEKLLQQHASWATELPRKPILPAVRSTLAEFEGQSVQLIF